MNAGNVFGKKKFLFVSWESLSGDVAWQLKKEGHEVKCYIKAEEDKDVYDGFLEKVDDWKKWVDWADCIFFDDIWFGKEAEELRKRGKLVFGGSVYTDKLEDDREFGQQEMQSVGINTLPRWKFTNFDEAIEFIKKNPDRYVFKPAGRAQNEKELLFVGNEDDGSDVVGIFERSKKAWSNKIKTFQLQKFASGVEVAVGAFFNGKEFIYPININFEHKRMFPGDLGPQTGEMGTLMYFSEPNALFDMTLQRMKPKLAKSGYVGYVDINCIANAKGIYPLEFTCRTGYPHISIAMEGISMPIGELIFRLASGENFDLKTKKGFQVGVVLAVPPFPFDDQKVFAMYKDSTIYFKKPNFDGVHLGDVKTEDGDWKVAGASGYVLVITGSGTTVEEARKQAYSRVQNIFMPNMFYRTDIGTKWYGESDKLQTWGYMY
ncbi:MAG: phosphoribosylamine--glycine ligase [Candidatus Aenigmarchaeota archaeon]|nr:phosphoribosylamine--glycine ligase [Candidatus Aenigmarchaeota archaeon]